MPKLSATSGIDPESITRVDITTEMIKKMSDAELEDLLRKMRGNREVSASSPRGGGKPRAAGTPKAPKTDDSEDFI
jgi:hypothetical protein